MRCYQPSAPRRLLFILGVCSSSRRSISHLEACHVVALWQRNHLLRGGSNRVGREGGITIFSVAGMLWPMPTRDCASNASAYSKHEGARLVLLGLGLLA